MQTANDASPSARPPGKHLPGLDGLRGIAILAVLLHHLVTPNYPEGLPGGVHGIIVRFFYRLCDVGWSGVDLFFVLSGFLITGILLDAKGHAHYFRNFYARRSLRIFPLYYGVLLAVFVLLPALASLPPLCGIVERSGAYAIGQAVAPRQGWLWIYCANIKMVIDGSGSTFGYLGHFWSLSVEEHFYLVWPFVVLLCRTQTLIRICLVVAVGALIARVVCLCAGMQPIGIFAFTLCRLDGLTLGGLVAAWSRLPDGWASLLPMARRALRFVAPVTLVALLGLARYRFDPVMILPIHTLLAISCAAVLPFAALAGVGAAGTYPKLSWMLCSRFLQTFGKYSYGIYVLHPFVVERIDAFVKSDAVRHVLGTSYEAYAIPRTLLGVSGAFVVAFLSWHLYEKHFLRLKAFFPSGRVSAPVETQPVAAAVTLPFSHAATD